MNTSTQRLLASILACVLMAAGTANAQSQRINGDVVRLEGSMLQIRSSDGQMIAVKVGDNTRFSGRSPADLERIVPGAFIGTTAVPRPDGTLTAVEVHIFPESMRGTGEGHRPMDTPGNTMTNATVSSVGTAKAAAKPGNTMTNATVSQIASGERRLTLTYPGGEKVVIVPADIPVVMVEPADRSLLVAGAHIIVNATRQPDGVLTAERITIGKNGFVPPL